MDSFTSAMDLILSLTGRASLSDAVAWIAEGHPLPASTDERKLLAALGSARSNDSVYRRAVNRLVRSVSRSDFDPGSRVLGLREIWSIDSVRHVLDVLKRKCPDGALSQINAAAVSATQRQNDKTVEVLCMMAGISYRDLSERLPGQVPSDPRGPWNPVSIGAAFAVIDEIITSPAPVGGTTETGVQPLEFVTGYERPGWDSIEKMKDQGVPYELLLTQRMVGSPWGAHRNRTSSEVARVIGQLISENLASTSISHVASKSIGGDVTKGEMDRLTGGGGQIVIAVLVDGKPRHGIALSVAREGGTARKNAGRLLSLPDRASVPVSVVIAGRGWSQRTETSDLALALEGRIYSERSLSVLASHISDLPNA